jgi:hypothetical protein
LSLKWLPKELNSKPNLLPSKRQLLLLKRTN